MLYTVKYAPKKLADVVGNHDRIEQIRQWILHWISGKKRRPLLVWGPPGIGKTSLAYALSGEYDLDVIEMNASELRDKGRVEKLTAGTMLAGSLFGRTRLVLIDDVDMLAGRKDSGGSAAISKFLKENPCPILLTASDIWDKKLAGIRNDCETMEFKKISKVSITKLLESIARHEHLSLDGSVLSNIAEGAGGDIRAALNDLHCLAPSDRDREKDIFNIVRTILKATSYAEVRNVTAGGIDYDFIKLWIDENIPHEYTEANDRANAYSCLSMADIFDGRIRKSKWQLLKYSIDLSTAGVALAKEKPYHKFTKYSFPSYLRRMSQSMARRAVVRSIGLKLGMRLHTSWRDALVFLPLIKHFASDHPERVMGFYDLDDEELAFIMETSASRLKSRTRKKST